MILIVGLGNPGEKYKNTRHNVGFVVMEALLRDVTPAGQDIWKNDAKTKSQMAKAGHLLMAKPQTMMNASGFAVTRLARYYKVKPEDVWVVHDDLDLPLGKMRIKTGGGSAGHRGVESIVRELGTDKFTRFRVGIGRPHREASKEKVEKYVLASFGFWERREVKRVVKKVVKMIELAAGLGQKDKT